MPAWPARRRRRARSARRRLGGSRSWPTTRARLPQRSRRRHSSVRSSSALLCRRSCRRVPPPSRTHSRYAATRSWKGQPRSMSSRSDAARLMLPQPALMTLAEQSASLARERTACAEELSRARAMGAPVRCCAFAMLRAARQLARSVIWPRAKGQLPAIHPYSSPRQGAKAPPPAAPAALRRRALGPAAGARRRGAAPGAHRAASEPRGRGRAARQRRRARGAPCRPRLWPPQSDPAPSSSFACPNPSP